MWNNGMMEYWNAGYAENMMVDSIVFPLFKSSNIPFQR